MTTPITRRQALKLGAAAAGAATLPLVSRAASAAVAKPKNIIFMVADGMSLGVPTLAEPFSQLVGRGQTRWHALAQRPETVHGFFDMASLNSLVTDSSAASSSWGSGSRIFNAAINMLPDGTKLQPIAHAVKESGRAMGLVTTVTVTHATPAGFAAVCSARGDEPDIAPQYLDLVDVILGGGLDFFDPKVRKDGRDVAGEYQKAGYSLLTRRVELESAAGAGKILGLFDKGYLPFTLDWNNNGLLQKRVPTLAEMSALALNNLRKHPGGFFIQIEGGRVDHAAHSNDPAAILWEQIAFDGALGVVLDFVRDNPDTLVIVTTDHGNSNPGLNGMGKGYADSNECFARLQKFTASTLTMQGDLQRLMKASDKPLTSDQVIARVKEGTALELSPAEGRALLDSLTGTPPSLGNNQHANFVGLLGEFTGNHTGIGWTGISHTADYVPILALGPGAEAFHGLVRNTDAYRRLTEFMGVNHVNPSMTPEEAAKYKSVAVLDDPPHWAA